MRRYFILLYAMLLQLSLSAQNQRLIDSLILRLENDLSYIEQVNAYVKIADEYAKSDSANTYLYANKAISLANEVKYQEGVIDALVSIGTLEIQKGSYEDALNRFEKIIQQADEIGHSIGVAKAYRGIGTINDYSGKYDEALDYFSKSLELFEAKGMESDVALNQSFISGVKRMQGDYAKALEYGLEALEAYQKLGDVPGQGLILNDVGLIYWNLGELDKALEYFGNSIEIHLELEDKRSIAYTTANIGMIHEENQSPTEALESYNQSIELLYELDDKRALAIILYNISVVYKDLKEWNLSLEYSFKSIAIRDELGVENEKSFPLVGVGRTYMEMGKMRDAKKYLEQGRAIASKYGMKRVEMEALASLSVVESSLGNYKNAFDYHVQFKNTADSLRNEENTRKITRLEAEYEFQKEKDSIQFVNERSLQAKNTEIELLNEREKVSRLQMLIVASVLILIVIIGFLVARAKVRAKELQTEALKEIGEFKDSMTSMIAHDLKNPLSVILNESTVDNNRQVARQMLQLVNNMLDVQRLEAAKMKLHLQSVSLTDLLAEIENQIAPLLKQRNLTLRKENVDYLVLSDKSILERILINLLTNAIKFSPDNETILLKVEAVGQRLKISVIDHGKGIAQEDQVKIFESFEQAEALKSGGIGSTGLGLTFCKLAVEAHGSHLGLISEPNEGSTFYFELESGKGKVAEIDVHQTERSIVISHEYRQQIGKQVEALRSFQLYQIGEIEGQLKELKGISDDLDTWVEEVLNAAYNGNKSHYDELLAIKLEEN